MKRTASVNKGRAGRVLAMLAMVMPATAGLVLTAPALAADRPEVLWAEPVGETDSDEDEIDGIAIDSDGNTTVTGVFRNEVRFGTETMSSAGAGDVFLASFTLDGELRWARQFGSTGDDNAFDLRADGDGNTVASGWFSGTVDFGRIELTSEGGTDMFVAKFDRRGRVLWARSFGGPDDDGGNEVDVLTGGGIAVSAISGGEFSVDGRTNAFGGGLRDAYAIRLTADGEVRWVRAFNGPGAERIRALSIAPGGEVYVGFQYQGTITAGATTLVSRGGPDGAATKLGPDGEVRWIVPVGGTGEDNVRGLDVAADGGVYASGLYTGTALIVDEQAVAPGGADYLTRLTPQGSTKWTVTASGEDAGTGGEIRADTGGPLLSTYLPGPLTIRRDGVVIGQVAPPGEQPSALFASFSPEGALEYSFSPAPIGPGSVANGSLPAISPDGRFAALAARFRGTIDAGGTVMTTPAAAGPDSAIVFLRHGTPRARIKSVKPRGTVRIDPGGSRRIHVKVNNGGDAVATDLEICPRVDRGPGVLRAMRCSRIAALEPGAVATVAIPVSAKRPGRGLARAGLTLRLRVGNGRGDAEHVKVAVRG